MPEFLQPVLLESFAYLTRAELDVFQSVCDAWRRDIRARGHILARLRKAVLSLSMSMGNHSFDEEGFIKRKGYRNKWRSHPVFSKCCRWIVQFSSKLAEQCLLHSEIATLPGNLELENVSFGLTVNPSNPEHFSPPSKSTLFHASFRSLKAKL